MADNAISVELGRTNQKLSENFIAHLSKELNLRFRYGYDGDTTVAHAYLENADDVPVALYGKITEGNNPEFVIELTWAGVDPGKVFIDQYRRKVTQALASLPA